MTCPPVNGLGAVCYLMEDGNTRSCRIEITRSTTAVQSGTYAGMYAYQINVWIEVKSTLSASAPLTLSHLQDVLVPFVDPSPHPISPKISQTVYFNSTDHGNLRNIFWGFTQGTGDLVQQVAITNSDVFFPNTSSTCTYSISPTGATYTPSGGSGSVTLTATSGCYWAVQSLPTNPWITITSTPLFGIGSGTINYSVAPNTGSAQTGYINIAGQTFTVNQCAFLSNYTITNNTGASIYPQSGGNCSSFNSIANHGTYTIAYNAAAVTFYQTRGGGNSCSGNSISISGAQAVAADANCNGNVQINSAWSLIDN